MPSSQNAPDAWGWSSSGWPGGGQRGCGHSGCATGSSATRRSVRCLVRPAFPEFQGQLPHLQGKIGRSERSQVPAKVLV